MKALSLSSLRTAAGIALLLLLAMPLWVQNANSQAPVEEASTPKGITVPSSSTVPIFSYQGQLLDADGNPITADIPMSFRLYDVATDGTACWAEDHTSSNTVNVSDGLFHVLLGQISAIDTACLAGDTYLELEVNGETLSPRELLTDVAKAVEAGTLVDGAITQGDLLLGGNLDLQRNLIKRIGTGDSSLTIGAGSSYAVYFDLHEGTHYIFRDVSTEGNPKAFSINKNGVLTAYGSLNMNENNIANVGRISSFADTDLTIDAGAGSINTLFLKDNVEVGGNLIIDHPNGSLYLNATSGGGDFNIRHGTSGTKELSIFGSGPSSTMDVEILDGDLKVVVGDITVGGNTTVNGHLSVGSCSTASLTSNREGTTIVSSHSDETCTAGSITGGAYIEANLQTIEERRAEGNKLFSKGDLLCWGDGKLELCDTPNDSLVQAVADAKGNPIVLGAEPIKVIGPVKKGDYLVASSVPGYAMASDKPTFGIVIGQALEDFEGEKGLIKAMIRKM